MLQPRLLSATQADVTYHVKKTQLWIQLFGNIEMEAMRKLNDIEVNPTFGHVLSELKKVLSEFFARDEHYFNQIAQDDLMQAMFRLQLREAGESDANPKQNFFEYLCFRQRKAFTLCSYLLIAFESLGPDHPLMQDQEFKTMIRYLSLLAATCAYNAAYLNCNYMNTSTKQEDVLNLINAYHKWMVLFECIDAGPYPDNVKRLKAELSTNTKLFERERLKAFGQRPMTATALRFHVDRKNERALEHGATFQGKLLYCPEATEFLLPNESMLAQFYGILKELTTATEPTRKQIMMIFNREFGHIEVFDIHFDPLAKKLTLLNVSPNASLAQFIILHKLQSHLADLSIHFKLYACQANLQGALYSDPYYVYALSGLCAKLPIEQFAQFQSVPQPPFADIEVPRKPRTMAELKKVQWIDLANLGEKALLLRGTLPQKKMTYYQQKYGMAYSQYLMRELDRRFNGLPLMDEKTILSKMQTADRGQGIRRGAAGLCPRAEFDELLRLEAEAPTGALDAKDQKPEKGFTPLMCSIDADKSSRASALCLAKADLHKKDNEQKDAFAHYAKQEANSDVKRNPVLKRFLN